MRAAWRAAELLAGVRAFARHVRERDRVARRAELAAAKAEAAALDEDLDVMHAGAMAAAEAVMEAAGYHRHKRGEWRRRRG